MKALVKMIAVCALACAAVYGQAVSQISGIVKDASGAVILGVSRSKTNVIKNMSIRVSLWPSAPSIAV